MWLVTQELHRYLVCFYPLSPAAVPGDENWRPRDRIQKTSELRPPPAVASLCISPKTINNTPPGEESSVWPRAVSYVHTVVTEDVAEGKSETKVYPTYHMIDRHGGGVHHSIIQAVVYRWGEDKKDRCVYRCRRIFIHVQSKQYVG